jgi:hypothetical protein
MLRSEYARKALSSAQEVKKENKNQCRLCFGVSNFTNSNFKYRLSMDCVQMYFVRTLNDETDMYVQTAFLMV